jgi:hypothetical protein
MAAKSTLFHVKADTAVGIQHLSAYKHEQEFLLAPGSQFKVSKVVKNAKGQSEIHLEELHRPRRVR